MFIKYRNTLYDSLDEKTYLIIITRVESKIDEQFLKSRKSYYKEISTEDTDIQEIFNIQFYLNWDSHLEKVNTVWELFTEEFTDDCLKNEQVLLVFAKGCLLGWKVEENTVCSRYVDINECEDFTVIYTYKMKDGERLEEPLKVEEKLTKEEFITKIIEYKDENI